MRRRRQRDWMDEIMADIRRERDAELAAEPLAVLGLLPGATGEEIQAAYRQKVRETHPDRGGSGEELRKVTEAWEKLKATEAR